MSGFFCFSPFISRHSPNALPPATSGPHADSIASPIDGIVSERLAIAPKSLATRLPPPGMLIFLFSASSPWLRHYLFIQPCMCWLCVRTDVCLHGPSFRDIASIHLIYTEARFANGARVVTAPLYLPRRCGCGAGGWQGEMVRLIHCASDLSRRSNAPRFSSSANRFHSCRRQRSQMIRRYA
jgi:hypothetical protein